MCKKRFYYWKENGKIVVQNMSKGMQSQRREYTPEDFRTWKKDIPEKHLIHIATWDE